MAYANVIANQKQLKKTNKENICKVKNIYFCHLSRKTSSISVYSY